MRLSPEEIEDALGAYRYWHPDAGAHWRKYNPENVKLAWSMAVKQAVDRMLERDGRDRRLLLLD